MIISFECENKPEDYVLASEANQVLIFSINCESLSSFDALCGSRHAVNSAERGANIYNSQSASLELNYFDLVANQLSPQDRTLHR